MALMSASMKYLNSTSAVSLNGSTWCADSSSECVGSSTGSLVSSTGSVEFPRKGEGVGVRGGGVGGREGEGSSRPYSLCFKQSLPNSHYQQNCRLIEIGCRFRVFCSRIREIGNPHSRSISRFSQIAAKYANSAADCRLHELSKSGADYAKSAIWQIRHGVHYACLLKSTFAPR